ncbi:MAG: hypothetical protein EWM45_06645 [Rhodopseudomonas palustris]|nr:MAG: hypothetical protein EWM45_06645 [Rhodopseudomonas palustris]
MSTVLAMDLEEPLDKIEDFSLALMLIFSKDRDDEGPNVDRALHRLAMEIHSQAKIIEQYVSKTERAA